MSEPDFDSSFAAAESRLWAWCHLRIPTALRSRLEPEDVVQECWIRGRRSFAEFDPSRASFTTWLIAIARNICSETMRKADFVRRRSDPFDSRLDAAQVGAPRSSISIRGRLAREEAFTRLLSTLQSLEPEEQELIARLGIEGATCAEVALTWDSTEGAVSKRWQRLRARLLENDRVREYLGVD